MRNAENAADAMMKRHPDLNKDDIAAAFKRNKTGEDTDPVQK